jgi:hypothetical protein
LGETRSGIFFQEGLDSQSTDLPVGQISGPVRRRKRSQRPLAERLGYVAEAVERGLQTFDNFGCDFVGRRQQIGIVERVIFDPEDIEIDLSRLEAWRLRRSG